MRLRTLSDLDVLPALDTRHAQRRITGGLAAEPRHSPRILLLYGSLPGFIAAELLGAVVGMLVMAWLLRPEKDAPPLNPEAIL